MLLENKVAIITGAGRGIGRAAAELFAQHGAKVIVSDIDATPLDETVSTIVGHGGEAVAVAGDVTAADFGTNIVQTTLQTFGTLDIIVNNAGYTWDGTLHKMSDAQWEAMLAVHLTAPFRLIRAAAEYLRETAKREKAEFGRAKARKIINVSSTSGTRGNAGQTNYAAGKAGIVGVTKTIAKEWGQFNIQANAVAYGLIETRLVAAKESSETVTREDAEIKLGVPEAMRQIAYQMIPLGRGGTPLEAAGAMLFFASPLADFVSGQVLEVTGGF